MVPSFHCERTSSQVYKWNSKSWPEGRPRKKKGISTANAAKAIERSGIHRKLLEGALPETANVPRNDDERTLPGFVIAASFSPTSLRAETLPQVGVHIRTKEGMVREGCPPLFNSDLTFLKPPCNRNDLR